MENMRGTSWQHQRNEDVRGVVTFHNPRTGRIALLRQDGVTYRGRLDNLRRRWIQLEETIPMPRVRPKPRTAKMQRQRRNRRRPGNTPGAERNSRKRDRRQVREDGGQA